MTRIFLLSAFLTFSVAGSFFSSSTSPIPVPKAQMVRICPECNHKKIYHELYHLAQNSNIDVVILVIDHTGGEVTDLCQVVDIITELRKKKPVIAFVQGKALSMGYLIACETDHIIAHSKSSLGAIGFWWLIQKNYDLSLKQENGVNAAQTTFEMLQEGKFKTICHPDSGPITEEQRASIQEWLHQMYELYLESTAKRRNLNLEESHLWAEGQIIMAPRALELGLIDKIGTIFDLENIALRLLEERYPDKTFAHKVELILPVE